MVARALVTQAQSYAALVLRAKLELAREPAHPRQGGQGRVRALRGPGVRQRDVAGAPRGGSRPLDLVNQVLGLARQIVTLVGFAALLFSLGPWAVLIPVATAVPPFWAEARYAREQFEMQRARTLRNRRSFYLEAVLTTEQTVKEAKLFQLARWLRDKFRTSSPRSPPKSPRSRGAASRPRSSSDSSRPSRSTARTPGLSSARLRARSPLGAMTLYLVVFRQETLRGALSSVARAYEADLDLTNLEDLLGKSAEKLEAYVIVAEEICALAYTNPGKARASLPKFLVFTEMEKQNEELSDHIEKVALAADKTAMEESAKVRQTLIIFALGDAIVMFLLSAWIGRSITRPIDAMVTTLEHVGAGKLNVAADLHGGTEVIRMATALNQALEKLRATMRLISASSTSIHSASATLNSRNEQTAAAESTATSASRLSSSGNEVSERLQAVSASGLDSLRLGSRNRDPSRFGRQETPPAAPASRRIRPTPSSPVLETNQGNGNVVAVISSIADQTNLLALNAAIELGASRRCRTRVRRRRRRGQGPGIANLRSDRRDLHAHSRHPDPNHTRRRSHPCPYRRNRSVNNVSTTIAAAVEEQTAVTKGIEEQLFDASRSTQDIAASVSNLAENANITNQNASESLTAARQLQEIAQ